MRYPKNYTPQKAILINIDYSLHEALRDYADDIGEECLTTIIRQALREFLVRNRKEI